MSKNQYSDSVKKLRTFLLKEENRNRIAIVSYVVYLAELILFSSMFGKEDSLQYIFESQDRILLFDGYCWLMKRRFT